MDDRLGELRDQWDVTIWIAVTAELGEAHASDLIERGKAKHRRRGKGLVTETGKNALILRAIEPVCMGDDGIHCRAQSPAIGFGSDHRP